MIIADVNSLFIIIMCLEKVVQQTAEILKRRFQTDSPRIKIEQKRFGLPSPHFMHYDI